jgi:pimeloyl-ACP methyl ester carboxylesterase
MIPTPIMLIHGFNGAPSNWTGPTDHFPEYLAAQGYDPDLIRVFNYGYMEYEGKRFYNNLGDLREIAHRLDEGNSDDPELRVCAVDRLSRDSAARGGPEKITLIAHSSGGLIARYYLSRQTEDQFGTRYRGNVARAIFLGTPHHGVDVEDILDPLPNRWIYGWMVRVHYLFPPDYHGANQSLRNRLDHLRASARTAWYKDDAAKESIQETPAFHQIHPGSEFLDGINCQGVMPSDVAYHNIFGDVSARIHVKVGGRILVNKQKQFGDGLVTSKSAGTIPNAESAPWPLAEEYCLEIELGRRTRQVVEVKRSGEHPMPIHRNLRSHPGSRKRILEILAR